MRMPKFTIRRMMMVVAMVAVGCAAYVPWATPKVPFCEWPHYAKADWYAQHRSRISYRRRTPRT